jgi:hypothetical protein
VVCSDTDFSLFDILIIEEITAESAESLNLLVLTREKKVESEGLKLEAPATTTMSAGRAISSGRLNVLVYSGTPTTNSMKKYDIC